MRPKRPLTFEQAKALYTNRYTMEHVPPWAAKPHQGRYYAPQFRTDAEWYKATKFPGEDGHMGRRDTCWTTGEKFPLGMWLDKPYRKGA